MEISLPNIHYFNIDMSKMGLINKEEVRTLKIFKAHLYKLDHQRNLLRAGAVACGMFGVALLGSGPLGPEGWSTLEVDECL